MRRLFSTLLAVVLASTVLGAQTITQVSLASKNASQGGGTITSQAQTHAAGNLLVALSFHQDAGDNISSCSNTAGDVWARTRSSNFQKNFGGSLRSLEIWYTATGSTFGSTPTGTIGATNDVVSCVSSNSNFYSGMNVYEFNKTSGTWGLVGDSNDSDGTTADATQSTGSFTLSNPSVLVGVIYDNAGSGGLTGSNGATVSNMTGDGFTFTNVLITASSQALASTTASAIQYAMLGAAFQASSGGGGKPACSGLLLRGVGCLQ